MKSQNPETRRTGVSGKQRLEEGEKKEKEESMLNHGKEGNHIAIWDLLGKALLLYFLQCKHFLWA